MIRARIALALRPERAVERDSLLELAIRRGFTRFVITATNPVPERAGLQVYVRGPDHLARVRGEGPQRVPLLRVSSPADLDRIAAVGRSQGVVAVEWSGDRMIPLENLLAAVGGDVEVWAGVDRLQDLPGMLGALERGASVVIVPIEGPSDLDRLESLQEPSPRIPLTWEIVNVGRVVPSGVGDRVLVDTTSLLLPEEGMLIGSAAAFLLHIASEAHGSQFSRARPFRVNAGAAHSYVLMADGTTRYLSELSAGDTVLVTSPNGAQRSVRVGRVKIERRPLVMIEVERGQQRPTVFLQEAETVRLSGEEGPVATTSVRPGNRVFGVPFSPARHLGIPVDETIEER